MVLVSRGSLVAGFAVALLAVGACWGGARNPLLGSWELDADQTGPGVAAFVRRMGDQQIEFAPEHVRIGDTELPVRYAVEERRVRVIRTDRQHEDLVELLEDGAIRVHFPAGYEAVYRRAPSRRSG